MASKIKILYIQSRICVGGPAVHTGILVTHLNPKRFQTILLGGGLEPDEKDAITDLQKNGIDVRVVKEMGRDISFWRDLKAVIQLYKIIRQERPDIVDTHTAKAGAIGRIAALLVGVPIVVHTFHGHVFHDYFGKMKTKFFQILEKLLARISTRIIVISPKQYQDIVETYKIAAAEKVTLIRCGFNLEKFLAVRKSSALKKALELPEDSFLLGIIGRLVPIKNHEMSLQMLVALRSLGVPAHLCIVGDGELRADLIQSVRDKNIEKYVHFLGWRLDIENIYSGLDTLILTSLNEGTPFTIIEAMASQVPVIATNVGGVCDLIEDGVTGLLCTSHDFRTMAFKAKQIFESSDLRERLVKNAKEFAVRTYSYERLIFEMENLYLELLAKNKTMP